MPQTCVCVGMDDICKAFNFIWTPLWGAEEGGTEVNDSTSRPTSADMTSSSLGRGLS